MVFQCPYHLRDNRHIFRSRNYSEIELPPGMSALEFLGLPEPPLPRVCLPREGDAAENRGSLVIKLDSLHGGEKRLKMENIVRSLTVRGEAPAIACRSIGDWGCDMDSVHG